MAWPAAGFTQWNAGTTSGPQAVPTSTTLVDGSLLWLAGACFTNTTGATLQVTVTDAAGLTVVKQMDVAATGVPTTLEFPLMPMTGLRWFASGAGVIGALWGSK